MSIAGPARQSRADLTIGDVGRDPLFPLLSAHVLCQLVAKVGSTCPCGPESDGVISTGRGQPPPVGAECQPVDACALAGQRVADLLAGGGIPESNCAVGAAGG